MTLAQHSLNFQHILLPKQKKLMRTYIYIDLDSEGNPVAITIEHANLHANLPDLFYEQIGAPEPQPLLREN